MKLLTSRQMQDLDREAIETLGIPSIVLMENAARALCAELVHQFPASVYPNVIALAGKGNNGADSIAAVRILSGMGYQVALALLEEPCRLKGDAALQLNIYTKLGLFVETVASAEALCLFLEAHAGEPRHTVVLDGLFGVGLQRPITSGFWADIVDLINAYSGPVLAVDLPSGVMESADDCARRVRADMTVTFQEPKAALIRPENRCDAGLIRVVDIGIPKQIYESRPELITWIDSSVLATIKNPKTPFVHKYQHGHGLAVLGSQRMPGAGILALRAAVRSGIGLCTALIPTELRDLFIGSCPEVLLKFRDDPLCLDPYQAVLIGPGLGRDESARDLVKQLFSRCSGLLILDADVLTLLAELQSERFSFGKDVKLVLTPHSGEMARLLGTDTKTIEADRFSAVRELSSRYQATVVLKGKYSLVSTESGRLFVNPSGNPGMATAGSGDVLSGLILGMVARYGLFIPMEQIVCAAVWLHGRSGDLAAADLGELALKAGDLIDYLPMAMKMDVGNGIQI